MVLTSFVMGYATLMYRKALINHYINYILKRFVSQDSLYVVTDNKNRSVKDMHNTRLAQKKR